MQATLIYNPHAGLMPQLEAGEILDALKSEGFDPVYRPTESEADLDEALSGVRGLVVTAGGDGTVRSVVARLAGRDVRLTPLPMGTANNIASVLGLEGSPLEIIAGLSDAYERAFDLGKIEGPAGTHDFIEAFGCGLYADTLATYHPEEGKSVARGLRSISETVEDYQPRYYQIRLDGEDLSGDYLLVEAMNTPTLGPRINLCPQADPGDGFLDLVLIHASVEPGYLQYLVSLFLGELETLPNVGVQRGKHLEIAWGGFPVHMDAQVLQREASTLRGTRGQAERSEFQVSLRSRAVCFLLPKGESD